MSTLTYALDSIDAKLRQEVEAPWVPPHVASAAKAGAQRILSGIQAHDHVREAEILEEARRERGATVRSYFQDKDLLAARLRDAGIVVLGFAPTKCFKTLSFEARLIGGLCPDANGSVRVAESAFADIPALAEEGVGKSLVQASIFGFLAGSSIATLTLATIGLDSVALAALGVVGGIALALASTYAVHRRNYFNYYGEPKLKAKQRMRAELAIATKRFENPVEAKRFLWPNYVEPHTGPRLKIALPEAPTDVQENLVRATRAGFTLELTTAAEALSFAESPVDVFVRERTSAYREIAGLEEAEAKRKAAEKERRAYEKMMRRDPIVTTSHGLATAIIVQYGGDFPAERELIDRVLNEPTNLI